MHKIAHNWSIHWTARAALHCITFHQLGSISLASGPHPPGSQEKAANCAPVVTKRGLLPPSPGTWHLALHWWRSGGSCLLAPSTPFNTDGSLTWFQTGKFREIFDTFYVIKQSTKYLVCSFWKYENRTSIHCSTIGNYTTRVLRWVLFVHSQLFCGL